MDKEVVFKVEKSLLKTTAYTLIFLSLIEILAYFAWFKNIDNYFWKYGYYMIFLVISILVNATAIWHIKAYKMEYSHMSGMMIGMTIGMTTGFSIGLIVGATNGMFIGSIAGLLIGMIAGGYVGNCCGIMGAMEGMMAGLMGGLMGAMTAVMTLNDNILLLTPILVMSMVTIIFGLIYMVYEQEVKHLEKVEYKGYDFLPFITINFITLVALSFLMVYGPKSFLFG